MNILKNIFAVIGLGTVLAVALGAALFGSRIAGFDPGFARVYGSFAQRLLASGDPGVAMMWAVPVKDGLSPQDVIESMKSIAASHNFLFVGESPFYKQIEAITGHDYRYVNFLSFCDAQVGKQMLEYRDNYSGFMPCRIALVEGKDGKLWLYGMNLDLMIYGGTELPADLKASALRVRDTIRRIMEGAAAGEF
jgi:uncharacterized protein (DUF302 family)